MYNRLLTLLIILSCMFFVGCDSVKMPEYSPVVNELRKMNKKELLEEFKKSGQKRIANGDGWNAPGPMPVGKGAQGLARYFLANDNSISIKEQLFKMFRVTWEGKDYFFGNRKTLEEWDINDTNKTCHVDRKNSTFWIQNRFTTIWTMVLLGSKGYGEIFYSDKSWVPNDENSTIEVAYNNTLPQAYLAHDELRLYHVYPETGKGVYLGFMWFTPTLNFKPLSFLVAVWISDNVTLFPQDCN